MEKNTMNPKVDWFFNKAGKWQEEYGKLRMITLDCGHNPLTHIVRRTKQGHIF